MFRIFIAASMVAAAAGLGAASVANAEVSPYPNCKTAALDGRYDIPSDDPSYGPWLDKDQDGIGCES